LEAEAVNNTASVERPVCKQLVAPRQPQPPQVHEKRKEDASVAEEELMGASRKTKLEGAVVETENHPERQQIVAPQRIKLEAAALTSSENSGRRQQQQQLLNASLNADSVPPQGAPSKRGRSENDEEETDPDVQIEREDSAWDALGARFENAASEGRYIDLTDEAEDRKLSPSQATADFAAMEVPIDPSTIVQPESLPRQHQNEDKKLTPLWSQITEAVRALKEVRTELCRMLDNDGTLFVVSFGHAVSMLQKINKRMKKIQNFCNDHAELVTNSAQATRRVEELNKLVHKANIIGAQCNRRRHVPGRTIAA
jgi:hypothetical protein